MVDLVKIRKKAKEKKEAEKQSSVRSAQSSVEKPSSVLGPRSSEQKKEPAKKKAPEAPTQTSVLSPQSSPLSPQSSPPASGERTSDTAPRSSEKLSRFLAHAGERRADEQSRAAELAVDQMEVLAFSLAGESYAVDIENVVEIVTPRAVTRVPNAEAAVVGIISLRGTIVTLIDARRRLRHPAGGEETPETRIVVVQFHGETMGFVVDHVHRVLKIQPSDLAPHPVVHASEQDECVRGVFRQEETLTILLDLEKLLQTRTLAASNP